MATKQQIVDEIYERVMESVRDAFVEKERISRSFAETQEDDIMIADNSEAMLIDLIEDRVLDVLHEILGDMIKDGDLNVDSNS